MNPTAKNNSRLLEILIAIAWIDGEVQPPEKEFLAKIAQEHKICSAAELQDMLAQNKDSTVEKCDRLLAEYLGSNPHPEDYDNLLTSVSKLIYSDDDIATEEANILTKIQNLDPNSPSKSTLSRITKKIQELYQLGLNKT